MSSNLGTEGRLPRSAAIGPRGSLTLQVGLCNLILQWDEWACGRAVQVFHAALSLGRSPTWTWLAHDWHRKWRIIVSVLDSAARHRVAPCCDQLLSSSQNTRTFRTAASRGMLLIASATSLRRRYTRGSTYTRVWILDIFWPSTRRVDLYADRLVCVYIRVTNWK